MGIFGSIGKALGSVAKVGGGLLSKAAPLASFIPGVGPLAAAGGGILGKALSGLGGGDAAVKGGGGGGGIGGILGSVLGALGGPQGAINTGLGALGTIGASKDMSDAKRLLEGAQGRARAAEEQRDPFRQALLSRLQGGGFEPPQTRDFSAAYADPTNPFASSFGGPAPSGAPGNFSLASAMGGPPGGGQSPMGKVTPPSEGSLAAKKSLEMGAANVGGPAGDILSKLSGLLGKPKTAPSFKIGGFGR